MSLLNITVCPMAAGVILPCNLQQRQYSAIGTGVVTLQGSHFDGIWETFLTLSPGGATTQLSQASADRYPFLRYTSSGTNTVTISGVQ